MEIATFSLNFPSNNRGNLILDNFAFSPETRILLFRSVRHQSRNVSSVKGSNSFRLPSRSSRFQPFKHHQSPRSVESLCQLTGRANSSSLMSVDGCFNRLINKKSRFKVEDFTSVKWTFRGISSLVVASLDSSPLLRAVSSRKHLSLLKFHFSPLQAILCRRRRRI
jgi:hypothetical protein